jgi:hypothetical protein
LVAVVAVVLDGNDAGEVDQAGSPPREHPFQLIDMIRVFA